MNYKVGDKVRIVDEKYGHKLEIGKIYTIQDVLYGHYIANNWSFMDEECEPAYIKKFNDALENILNE